MIVGCYEVDLYCDNSSFGHADGKRKECEETRRGYFPQSYTCQSESECLKQARADGWTFAGKRPKLSYCPACSKKAKK